MRASARRERPLKSPGSSCQEPQKLAKRGGYCERLFQEANSYETTAENKTAHFYCPVLGYQKTEAGRAKLLCPFTVINFVLAFLLVDD
jgi:hypothetical protein